MVPVITPLLLALLLPHPALLTPSASTGLQLRGQRSRRATQDSIKVIISEGCSSPGASTDSSQAGKELDLSPGSPLVLTHKIRLVPSSLGSGSCGCETHFAALRERLENLEREVSALREKCGGAEGTCCTSKESKGAGCSITPDPGECPNDCSDQGRCVDGRCVCFPGFSGPECSESSCPGNCSRRGRCVNGRCLCDPGFTGADCSSTACPDGCGAHGRCVDGKCACDAGFSGASCADEVCPGNCNRRGRCVDGRCVCNTGFTGPDCSTHDCPDNCNERGSCLDGRCVCHSGYSGADCSYKSCPRNCNNRGRCVQGQCECDDGFTGDDCSQKACPNHCGGRGRCVSGKCVCEAGFSGPDCASRGCLNNCKARGRCIKGSCVCRRGFTGPDCSQCQGGRTGPNCETVMSGVSHLSPQDVTETSVTLVWTPPAIQYDTYHMTFSSQKESDQLIPVQVDGGLSSFTQTGLAAGQEYNVTLVGELDGRRGAATSTIFRTFLSGPTNLHVVKTTSTSAVVQWEESRAVVDMYLLTVTPRDGGGRSLEITIPFGQNSAHIQQLEAGRTYDMELVAQQGESRSRPAATQAVPGVTLPRVKTPALDPQVTQAPGPDGKSKSQSEVPEFYHQERKTQDLDSVRNKIPLTPISKATAANSTRLRITGRPSLPGKPKLAGLYNFSTVRGASNARSFGPLKKDSSAAKMTGKMVPEQSETGVLTAGASEREPSASSADEGDDRTPAAAPDTESGTNRQSSSHGPRSSKEQTDVGMARRGNDTDPPATQPTTPPRGQEKKCVNKVKVTHLSRLRGGVAALQRTTLSPNSAAPPSGNLDPLHKLLTDTFESLNVTTFSVHLSNASNLSHDENTVKEQLLGSFIPLSSFSSSSSPSASESSSQSSESSSPLIVVPSSSPSSSSIPDNSGSPGNSKPHVDDLNSRTDRKQSSLSRDGEVPFYRRTLPQKHGHDRRPHQNLDSFQNRAYPNTRFSHGFRPGLNPEAQTGSPAPPSGSEESFSDEVVPSLIYPSENREGAVASKPSGVTQHSMLTDRDRPLPQRGSLRQSSILRNRTQPNRRPFTYSSRTFTPETDTKIESLTASPSPLISMASSPSDITPETEGSEGPVGGSVTVDFSHQTVKEKSSPSRPPFRRTGFFRRPQLQNGSAQNHTKLRFPQRGPIRKPFLNARINMSNRYVPGEPPNQQRRDSLKENPARGQNVLGLMKQGSPPTIPEAGQDGSGPGVRQPSFESKKASRTTEVQERQTLSSTDPASLGPDTPPEGPPVTRTIPGERHSSGLTPESKWFGQEDNVRTNITGSDTLKGLGPEVTNGATTEGRPTAGGLHSRTLRPPRPDESQQRKDEESTTTNTDINIKHASDGGGEQLKNKESKAKQFIPVKKQTPTKALIKEHHTQIGSQDIRATPEKMDLHTGGSEDSDILKKNTGPPLRRNPKPLASRPSGPVRPMNRKVLPRPEKVEDPPQVESQSSGINTETSSIDLKPDEETIGKEDDDGGDGGTVIRGTPPLKQPDTRPVTTLKQKPPPRPEHHTSVRTNNTGARSQSSTEDTASIKKNSTYENVTADQNIGTTATGQPDPKETKSRPMRPVLTSKNFPTRRAQTEERSTQRESQDSTGRPGSIVPHSNKENTPNTMAVEETNSKPSINLKRQSVTLETGASDSGSSKGIVQEENTDAGKGPGTGTNEDLTFKISGSRPQRPVTPLKAKPVISGSRPQRPVTPLKAKPVTRDRAGERHSQTISRDMGVRPESSQTAESRAASPDSSNQVTNGGKVTGSVVRGGPALKPAHSRVPWPGPASSPRRTTTRLLHTPTQHHVNPRGDRPQSTHTTKRPIHRKTALSPASGGSPHGVIKQPPVFGGVTNHTSDGPALVWDSQEGKHKHFAVSQKIKEKNEQPSERNEDSGDDIVSENSRLRPSKQPGTQYNNRVPGGSVTEGPVIQTGLTSKPSEGDRGFKTVVPGSARSLQDLLPKKEYTLTLLGTGPGVLSRLHKLVVSTGPEPPTNIVFSKVTENSVRVSWTKPPSPVSGFKVTYTHAEQGEPISVSVDSGDSSLELSQLAPGSSYEVAVVSTLGLDESDALNDLVVTRPDPPTDLRAVNISDSSALLLWRPALAAVDQYSIVYGAGTDSEVRITVSGNAAEQQLSDLRESSTYTVTITSRLGDQDSSPAAASFTTTAGGSGNDGGGSLDLQASNVTPRTAALSWKPPSLPVERYRLTYQTDGQEVKEVVVDASLTQVNLSRLHPGALYSVQLQAKQRGGATTESATHFSTGSLRFPFPSDCSQELLNGATSGEAEIFPGGKLEASLTVYCDMETNGGGWTVFQRRKDGSEEFFRGWKDYVRGFGSVSGEFWLGLDSLHNLTSATPMTLRVDLRDGDDAAFAQYSTFQVARRNYKLTVGGYSGTAGDSFSYHNNRIFSTRDRDPGTFITRCAMSYRGGWWYKNCHQANLNGLYGVSVRHQGVVWNSWKGKEFSIPFTEMKMRPTAFRPPARG